MDRMDGCKDGWMDELMNGIGWVKEWRVGYMKWMEGWLDG